MVETEDCRYWLCRSSLGRIQQHHGRPPQQRQFREQDRAQKERRWSIRRRCPQVDAHQADYYYYYYYYYYSASLALMLKDGRNPTVRLAVYLPGCRMLGALYVLSGFGADRRIVFLSDTGFAVWRFCATSARAWPTHVVVAVAWSRNLPDRHWRLTAERRLDDLEDDWLVLASYHGLPRLGRGL